jgi:uncharacterized protein YbcI
MRFAFQETMERELVAGVEKITGQKVLAFLSSNHIDPDIAVETFILDRPRTAHATDSQTIEEEAS